MGRPSSYTPELAQEICERLSTGKETLVDICRDEHMPAYRTVSDWKRDHSEFSADFACARAQGFDAIAADCLVISNTPQLGEIVTEKPLVIDGKAVEGVLIREVKQEDMLGHRKLQIETRLKLLAKWDPKRYGETLKLSGDPEAPLLPPPDPAATLAAIFEAARQRKLSAPAELEPAPSALEAPK